MKIALGSFEGELLWEGHRTADYSHGSLGPFNKVIQLRKGLRQQPAAQMWNPPVGSCSSTPQELPLDSGFTRSLRVFLPDSSFSLFPQ